MDNEAKQIKSYYTRLKNKGLTGEALLQAFVNKYGLDALDYASNLDYAGTPY